MSVYVRFIYRRTMNEEKNGKKFAHNILSLILYHSGVSLNVINFKLNCLQNLYFFRKICRQSNWSGISFASSFSGKNIFSTCVASSGRRQLKLSKNFLFLLFLLFRLHSIWIDKTVLSRSVDSLDNIMKNA